jgi:hypothetical protein
LNSPAASAGAISKIYSKIGHDKFEMTGHGAETASRDGLKYADAAAYGRDFKRFQTFARQAAPHMLILGPRSVGEGTGDWGSMPFPTTTMGRSQ